MTNEVTDADSDVEQASGSAAGSTVSRDVVTGFNRANQDVGADEAQSRGIVNDSEKWSANNKRTFDEYQDLALVTARRAQEDHDQRNNLERMHLAEINALNLQRIANSVGTDKIGDNRMWTMDTEVLEAMAALVAAKILDTGDQTS